MLLLKLLPFSRVSRLVLDYMENSYSNKPSTNRKYPLGFFFSILIALSTISLMDGSPAVSFGRSTSYCIWEYSKSPVWKSKSLDCEAHLDLDENRWKSCKYKRNSINTDSILVLFFSFKLNQWKCFIFVVRREVWKNCTFEQQICARRTYHVINFLRIDLIKPGLVPHIFWVFMFVQPLLDQILSVQPLSYLTRVLGIWLILMQKFSATSAEHHLHAITMRKINELLSCQIQPETQI